MSIDDVGSALLRELCDYAESSPFECINESVRAVLDGGRRKQACKCQHACGRWRIRPASDEAPDYWLCAEASVYYGRPINGPRDSIARAIAGEQTTIDDALTDTSPWIIHRVLPDVIERFASGSDGGVSGGGVNPKRGDVGTGPHPRWRIRRYRKATLSIIWNVFEPNGEWSGAFDTWHEAIVWATDPFIRLDYWRAHQPPARA